MTRKQVIARFIPAKLDVDCVELIRLDVGPTRADGTLDVTIFVDDEELDEFVSTQAEIKVLSFAIAGLTVRADMLARAEEAKQKREKAP
jgi:hypothetical protein